MRWVDRENCKRLTEDLMVGGNDRLWVESRIEAFDFRTPTTGHSAADPIVDARLKNRLRSLATGWSAQRSFSPPPKSD